MIGRGGEGRSGISVLSARHDDIYIYIYIYMKKYALCMTIHASDGYSVYLRSVEYLQHYL